MIKTITDFKGINIGDTINVYSRTDRRKTIKRKIVEKSICQVNGIHVRYGYKMGSKIYFPTMDGILNLNKDIESFSADVDFKLYGVYSEKEEMGTEYIAKGDLIKQYIGVYKGMDIIGSRVFIDNTLSNGKKDIWYLNSLSDCLPKEKRFLINF